MKNLELVVAYDALCGWTYAANPLMEGLAEYAQQRDIAFSLLPIGLWVGAAAMDYTPAQVDFYWNSDLRITQLTGQQVSEAYRQNILLGKDTKVDSWATALGAARVESLDVSKHLSYLVTVQQAKYVEGLDTAKVNIIVELLNRLGLATELSDLQSESNTEQAQQLIQRGRELMASVGGQGAPTFILKTDQKNYYLDHQPFYGKTEQFVDYVRRVSDELSQLTV